MRGASPGVCDCVHAAHYANIEDILSPLELHRAGRLDEAIAGYWALLEAQPDAPELWHNLGAALRASDRALEAVVAHRRALALAPDDAEGYSALGLALAAAGLPERAVHAQRAALARDPALVAAHVNLGNALRASAERAQACDAYRAALALDPRSAPAWFNLHAALYDDRDPSPALAALARARALRPEHELTRFYDAALRAWHGEPEAERELSSLPEHLVASYRFARAQRTPQTRLFADTFATLEHALDLAPGAGLVLELGVRFGTTLRFLAARVHAADVHGFDSFAGLPSQWRGTARGSYSTGGIIPRMPSNVRLHAGLFERTLPGFLAAHAGPVRLLHVDCDLYESARGALALCGPRLAAGTIIVFDDYLCNPGWEQDEHRAWREAAERENLTYEYCAFGLFTRQAVIRVKDAAGRG